MCNICEPQKETKKNERRSFLRLAGISASTLMLSGILPKQAAFAASTASTSPKPENDLNPQQALARLLAGNTRYVQGVAKRHDFVAEREALVGGQNPFAAVLGCADSRIAPEYAFDTSRGDLFAVRIAGNFVTTDGLASLEYAVAVLGTPLILVLGHDSCGAISAGVKAVQEDTKFPGQIQSLADAVKPSVEKVLKAPGDILENAITQNVKDTVSRLKHESPILSDALEKGKLNIVGGVYKLSSGKVEMVA
ncbi:carbonic anhydrase [Pseudomonas chlororaphis]|uniref:carbonic anhydrase n=1 Tax=Pseudomonas chlororaphis TaxID=587753 RepID=UPI001926F9A5|nr:carbonic anhydrase [Pseudomonas chlororaphis]QQX57089.1 carbonic anhydrase [Pseudomonas chlororaphis subsp. aurantiaca]